MPKAEIKMKDGSVVIIEGTEGQVAKILKSIQGGSETEESIQEKKFMKKSSNSSPTLTDKIRELIAEGDFDKPIGLAQIKTKLEEQGHFYPVTTLSERVLQLTKNKELGRLKKDGKWVYVKR